MHPAARQYIAEAVANLPQPPRRVVEIGARNINGGVRDLFPDAEYIGVDIAPGPGVDVVADGASYRPEDAPDCVVCAETLEHAGNWTDIVAHCLKMLSPGGVLIVTAAGEGRAPHSAIDGAGLREGEYYGTIGERELMAALVGFAEAHTRVNERERDIYATAFAPEKPKAAPKQRGKRKTGAR